MTRSTTERARRFTVWLYALAGVAYVLMALTVVGVFLVVLYSDTVADFLHESGITGASAAEVQSAAWITLGWVLAIAVSIPLGVALFRVGMPMARRLLRSAAEWRTRRRAQQAMVFTPSIGRTTDGQPIYPVVGYTSDGKPVTADRAVNVRGQTTGTNGLAIAALILSFAIAPVGLILGFVARAQINKSGQPGGGLALAAIIVGGAFTAINVITFVALAATLGMFG